MKHRPYFSHPEPLGLICIIAVGTVLRGTDALAAIDPSPGPYVAEGSIRVISDDTWLAARGRHIIIGIDGGRPVRGLFIDMGADFVRLRLSDGAMAVFDKAHVRSMRVLDASEVPGPTAAAPSRADDPDDHSDTASAGQREGFRRPGGYILLSPGISRQRYTFGVDVHGPSRPTYNLATISLAAGIYRPTRSALTVAAGLLLQDAIASVEGAKDLHINLIRIGPELRIGASSERWFTYGLLDVHFVVDRQREGQGPGTMKVTYGGIGTTLGAGAQRLFGTRFVAGVEAKVPLDYEFSQGTFAAAKMLGFICHIMLGAKF